MFTAIFDQCFSCRKKKFFVRKREVQLPVGPVAKSREKFCSKCFKELSTELKKYEQATK